MRAALLKRLLLLAVATVVSGLEVATRGYRSLLRELYSEEGDTGVDDFVQDDSGNKPSFLQPSSDQEISVVNFYKDRCEPCENFKGHFISLADQVHHMTEEGHLEASTRTITFHAVHCSKHPKLCNDENVIAFPSVRAYSKGKAVELNTAKLHPYDVLRKLHFDIETLVQDKVGTDTPYDLGKRRKETGDRIKDALGWILRNELYQGSSTNLPEAMRGLLRLWLAQLNHSLPQIKPFTSDLLQRYKYISKSKEYLAPILAEHGVKESPMNCEAIYDLFQSVLIGSMEYNYLGFDRTEKLHPALVVHTNYQFVKQYVNVCDLQERFVQKYEACREDTDCPYYSALHLPDDLRAEPSEQDWKMVSVWWARSVRPQPFPSKTFCPTCSKGNDSSILLRFLRLEYGAFHSSIEDITPLSKKQGFAVHHASLFVLVVLGLVVNSGTGNWLVPAKRRRRYTLSIAIDSNHSKGE